MQNLIVFANIAIVASIQDISSTTKKAVESEMFSLHLKMTDTVVASYVVDLSNLTKVP